jgi:CRISPR-associated protein Cmr4
MTRPKSSFLWLRAETFIHVGEGETGALIDLPFAREAATDYPYIPGSGVKGAFRDMARLWKPMTNGKDHDDDKREGPR